jgi:hypothetical protein
MHIALYPDSMVPAYFVPFLQRDSGQRRNHFGRVGGVHGAEARCSIRFENTITERSSGDVFAYLADFEKVPTWNYAIAETRKISEGPRSDHLEAEVRRRCQSEEAQGAPGGRGSAIS